MFAQKEMLIGRSHTAVYLSGYTLKGQQQMRSQLNSIERLIAAAKCKKQSVTTPYTEKPFPLFSTRKNFFFSCLARTNVDKMFPLT